MVLLEQEIKFRIASYVEGMSLLSRLNINVNMSRQFERNILYDFPDRRMFKRDEVLRLRCVDGDAWLTWKGPQQENNQHIKCRKEVETSVGDSEAMLQILESMGVIVSFRYEKYRSIFPVDDVIVALDETPIGVFIEIEGEPSCLTKVVSRLELDMKQGISLSYPRLYERYCSETPGAPMDMVFG